MCAILPVSIQRPNYLGLIAFLHQGERLDHSSCEALEVVLKSLHFDFISLQAAQLEENVSFMSKSVVFFSPLFFILVPIQFHIQTFPDIRLKFFFLLLKETS